jgi:hypothetical protein
MHFAGEHGVSERQKGVALSLKAVAELRQVSEVEIILRCGMRPHHAFNRLTTYLGVFCSQFALLEGS